MTAQKIFNIVCGHLFVQGRKSVDDVSCLYFGPNGTRCAVGCLMTEADAKHADDGAYGISEVLRMPNMQQHQEHALLLLKLQRAHDSGPWHELRGRLKKVAKGLGLEIPRIFA